MYNAHCAFSGRWSCCGYFSRRHCASLWNLIPNVRCLFRSFFKGNLTDSVNYIWPLHIDFDYIQLYLTVWTMFDLYTLTEELQPVNLTTSVAANICKWTLHSIFLFSCFTLFSRDPWPIFEYSSSQLIIQPLTPWFFPETDSGLILENCQYCQVWKQCQVCQILYLK